MDIAICVDTSRLREHTDLVSEELLTAEQLHRHILRVRQLLLAEQQHSVDIVCQKSELLIRHLSSKKIMISELTAHFERCLRELDIMLQDSISEAKKW